MQTAGFLTAPLTIAIHANTLTTHFNERGMKEAIVKITICS